MATGMDMHARHGAILACAEITHALYELATQGDRWSSAPFPLLIINDKSFDCNTALSVGVDLDLAVQTGDI